MLWAMMTPPELTEPQRRLVLQVLLHGPLVRAELARRLNLSAASVTRLATPLLETGLIHQCEPVRRGASRPQVPLDMDPSQCHVLGVNLTAHHLTATWTDLRCNCVHRERITIDRPTPDRVVEVLTAAMRRTRPRPRVVGVALGGATPDGRTLSTAPFLGWRDVPLAEMVEASCGVPTVIGNDVEALTLGEGWFGAARGIADYSVVTVGAGVGFCTVRSGRLLRGRDAGRSVGALVWADPVEGGAWRGQDFICDEAMAQRFRVLSGQDATPEEVVRLARAQDPAALAVTRTWARRAGVLVATGAAFTLPELTVLTGERAHVAADHPDDFAAGMAAVRDPDLPLPRVEVLPHDRYLWARGAAVLAVRQLLGVETDHRGDLLVDFPEEDPRTADERPHGPVRGGRARGTRP